MTKIGAPARRRAAYDDAAEICVHRVVNIAGPGRIGVREETFLHAWQPAMDPRFEWCPRCGDVRPVEVERVGEETSQ